MKASIKIPIDEGRDSLQFLRAADLQIVPFERIKEHTDVLVRCGIGTIFATPDEFQIFRGLVMEPEQLQDVKHADRISYRRRKDTDTLYLNRASSNTYQVFYGATPTVSLDDTKLAAVLEIDSIRDDSFPERKFQYIAMGRWYVRKPLTLAVVGMQSEMASTNPWAQHLINKDKEFYAQIEESKFVSEVHKFIADEFSKKIPEGEDYRYKISAAYGDSLFDVGLPGIVFPSVQTEAKSFNVAIKSDFVDDKFIEIDVAAVMRGYKIKKEIIWGWSLQCDAIKDRVICWTDAPVESQITQEELDRMEKTIEAQGYLVANPRVILP